MLPYQNEDMPGMIESGMRDTYEERFLDPINRIFSYAYKQDFKNYAENEIPKFVSLDSLREEAIDPKRLIDKAVKTEVISTDMLTDNVLHKKMDRIAAIKNTNYLKNWKKRTGKRCHRDTWD